MKLLVRELVAVLISLSPDAGQPVRLQRPIPLPAWKALFARGWLAREGDSVWLTKAGRARVASARRAATPTGRSWLAPIAVRRRDIGSATVERPWPV